MHPVPSLHQQMKYFEDEFEILHVVFDMCIEYSSVRQYIGNNTSWQATPLHTVLTPSTSSVKNQHFFTVKDSLHPSFPFE